MAIDILVPTLGESVAEATVGKWYKKAGESVAKDELLVELETDKVTLEVNAPEAGAVSEIVVEEGGEVEVGALLARIEAGASGAEAAAPESPAASKAESVPEAAAASTPAPTPVSDGSGPAARKMMAENNLSSSDISGSGKDGRVTKGDVINALNSGASRPASSEPREERVKMTKLRKAIAKRLKESQNTAAMLTTFNEVDMTNVMALRNEYKDLFIKEHDTKLGFMSFFTKAVVAALKELPAVNAEIDGDDIVYKNYYDIGMAVGTPQGLVVPVIRDCDQLSMAGIESELVAMAGKARDGKLSMDEMSGGTFTITNGGVYGSMLSTPIINPPQSAILGLHNIVKRAVVMEDGSIQARPMMYIALSYDHRIIDGREAVTFLVRVKQIIEDPRRLLLGL